MGRNRKRSSSFSEDEDNIPLKLIRTSTSYDEDPNSYDSLCMLNNQPCELCDQVSKNRYTSLIHNARHIIIPLINQTVHQCQICLHHFTSQSDLNQHKSRKHSINLVSRSCNKPEDDLYESDLAIVVKQEKLSHSETVCPSKSICKDEKNTSNSNNFSIKNRLLFEEDIVSSNSDRLLVDLTTDCQVKVEWIPPIWEIEYPKSVHYDELIKPGVFRCKKCLKAFPCRFTAIIHEANHIYFKNSQVTLCKLCNQYILGDINKLKHHQQTSHPQYMPPRDKGPLKKYFGGKSEENGVIDEPFITHTTPLKFCDICFSFCKNNSTLKYDCVGELSEVGKRHKCQKCGCNFFVVKLVNRETKYKYSSFANRRNKKSMTNHDRLKNIAKRLKRMKKTYLFVLFVINYIIYCC